MKYLLLILLLAGCPSRPWAVVAKSDQLILITADGKKYWAKQISTPYTLDGEACVWGDRAICGSSLSARLIRIHPLNGIDPSELIFDISPSPRLSLKP